VSEPGRHLARGILLAAMLTLGAETALARPIDLEVAIMRVAAELSRGLEAGAEIAVISFGADSIDMSSYIIDGLIIAFAGMGEFAVAGRPRLDASAREMPFRTDAEIDDAEARRIGQFMGVRAVIAGAFESRGDFFVLGARAIEVEAGAVLAAHYAAVEADNVVAFLLGVEWRADPGEPPGQIARLLGDPARLWTVGVSAGTSLADPWVIATLHGTLAPFRFWFIRLGADAGFISGIEDASYFSLYPFAHVAFFMPFCMTPLPLERGGFYVGAGAGFAFARYSFPDSVVSITMPKADFTAGVNIGNMLDISYTLRTDFSSFNGKISVGFTHRFWRGQRAGNR